MDLGRLLLRTTVGGLFVGHGTQKLFGWFDGPGIDGLTEGFTGMGIHPAKPNAIAAAVTETAGGAALALGVATPLAAGGLIATMLTAIRTVHWRNGLWSTNGGWEYNAVLIAACAALAGTGPRRASAGDSSGSGATMLALALGVAGAAAAKLASDAMAPASETPAPGVDDPASGTDAASATPSH